MKPCKCKAVQPAGVTKCYYCGGDLLTEPRVPEITAVSTDWCDITDAIRSLTPDPAPPTPNYLRGQHIFGRGAFQRPPRQPGHRYQILECAIENMTLADADLSGCYFADCTFEGVTMTDTDLTDTRFKRSYFYRVDFTGSTASRETFSGCIFTDCIGHEAFINAGLVQYQKILSGFGRHEGRVPVDTVTDDGEPPSVNHFASAIRDLMKEYADDGLSTSDSESRNWTLEESLLVLPDCPDSVTPKK